MWSDQDVLDVVDSLTLEPPFKERDDEYARRRDLCFQRRAVVIPGIKDLNMQFRSPEIEDDGHAFKNRMLAAPVKINVAAIGKSEASQSAAQNLENFFYRYYHKWRDLGVFDGPLFDQATLGIGWVHLALNTEILPVAPEYDGDADGYMDEIKPMLEEFASGERTDMFILEPIQPDTMYYSPDKQVLVYAAVMPLNPLAEMYGKKGIQLGMDDEGHVSVSTLADGENVQIRATNWSQTVTLYTVETSEYCYHVLYGSDAGHVIGKYRNYFGTPTFFPIVGEATGNPHPLYAYRPLTNGKYQTVPIKNVLTTAMMTSGVETAQQRWALEWTSTTEPEPEDANPQVVVNEDGVVVPPPGYKLVNSGLAVGNDLPRALEAIEALDKYGYPKALNRPEEVDASSGYDRARQQDAVASLLDPPLSHFSTAITQILKALAHAVREIDLPVTVRNIKPTAGKNGQQKEVTLKPSDAMDADVSVTFNSITVFSRIAMQEEGLKLMQADMMSETQFLDEVIGVDDLESFRDQRALDKTLKYADDRAIQAVNAVIDGVAAGLSQQAMVDNNVPLAPPILETNGQQIRSDRGGSIPTGPGSAMPLQPTPPLQSELGQTAGAV